MISIAFGLGFLLASIGASFIIRANKKTFFRTLRETNTAWRGYEQDTVKLYELRGRTEITFQFASIIDLLEKQRELTPEQQEIIGSIAISIFDYYGEAFKGTGLQTDPTFNNPDEAEGYRQWLSLCKQRINQQLQAIYNEHNKGGFLQRKER